MTFKLFVRNLSFESTNASVKTFFEEFGPVEGVRIRYDHRNLSKGFGFIFFEDEDAGQRVLVMGEHLIDGRIATCHPVTKRSHIPRTAEEEVLSYIGLFS